MVSESRSELFKPVEETMQRQYHIDLLAIFFGIGTWVVVNGLWVELPLLVQTLPEGWNLPSYLTVIVQMANIAPILYTILHSLYRTIITESRVIYFVIGVGLLSNVFLLFYWDETVNIAGTNRSVGLLVLVFCLAMVDTSSRVLYLPFMARFHGIYLTSFFIGEGLSGFVPSIFALIQGVGGNPECRLVNVTNGNITEEQVQAFTPPPLFTIEIFFILLFITVLVSLIAFHLLTYESITSQALVTPPFKTESPTAVLLNTAEPANSFYQSISPSVSEEEINGSESSSRSESPIEEGSASKQRLDGLVSNNNADLMKSVNEIDVKAPLFQYVTKGAFIYLLVIQAFVCALSNGVFPSIQSYSCLPYGNVAYHWTATLSTIANPAVCFLLFALPKPTKVSITSVLVASLGVAAYVMTTAVMSPTPPLIGETSGEVLLVLGWILLVGTFTYVKVSVATLLRAEGKRGLFWCGAITQVGSAVGAIISFLVVNETTIFKSYNACQDISDITTENAISNLVI